MFVLDKQIRNVRINSIYGTYTYVCVCVIHCVWDKWVGALYPHPNVPIFLAAIKKDGLFCTNFGIVWNTMCVRECVGFATAVVVSNGSMDSLLILVSLFQGKEKTETISTFVFLSLYTTLHFFSLELHTKKKTWRKLDRNIISMTATACEKKEKKRVVVKETIKQLRRWSFIFSVVVSFFLSFVSFRMLSSFATQSGDFWWPILNCGTLNRR